MKADSDILLESILVKLDMISLKMDVLKPVMNIDEFCNYLGTSKRAAYRMTSENLVPHYKPNGKNIFFKRSEIDEWITRHPVVNKVNTTKHTPQSESS